MLVPVKKAEKKVQQKECTSGDSDHSFPQVPSFQFTSGADIKVFPPVFKISADPEIPDKIVGTFRAYLSLGPSALLTSL
jgi:hypothetical protein